MTALPDEAALDDLWNCWKTQSPESSMEDLIALLATGGTNLSEREMRFALAGAATEALHRDGFADRIVPLLGGPKLKVAYAFDYVSPEGEPVPTDSLHTLLMTFHSDDTRLDAMLEEMDRDGDGLLSREDFLAFYPEGEPATAYRATALSPHRVGNGSGGGTASKQQLERAETSDLPPFTATSPLQLQIGFFRLLQGAAYRCFRESYSANAETHLRTRDLPYTITDFDTFVTAAVDLYLALDVLEDKVAQKEFRDLAKLVSDEVAALRTRIRYWRDAEKTQEMRDAEARLETERNALASNRRLFAECVEYLLALRLHGIGPDDAAADSLSQHELNRLRHTELAAELTAEEPKVNAATTRYLDTWNPVLIDDGARPDGAIMPVRFWYETFMPQLLRCASIMSEADLQHAAEPDEIELQRWHSETTTSGAFDTFATDLRDGFTTCPPRAKLALRQAWRLTEHYLNGLEKRREREEFGRSSGYISQYVAFVDVWLGRNDVADSGMRLSFPYYIGPPVWCFLHSAAERIEALELGARSSAIEAFKRFFRAFAKVYPCPYCRHHLNRYVVRNTETDQYPVEFLFLGQKPDKPLMAISLEDRLTEIATERPGSLRRFVWKLHNAVSASIQRTEPWYQREDQPIYTTRHWPSLDAEVARAQALGQRSVSVDRLSAILEVLHPVTRLATLRDELKLAMARTDQAEISRIAEEARTAITALDKSIETTSFLQRTYSYDASRTEGSPHFSPEEEMFARSGRFIER